MFIISIVFTFIIISISYDYSLQITQPLVIEEIPI